MQALQEIAPQVHVIERRQWPRTRVPVQTELRLKGRDVPIRVKTSDLSVGGCYVEMMFTFELGSKLEITMWIGEAKVKTEGMVVTRHLQFGNGIQFTTISVDDQLLLNRFLDDASAETSE
jgi:c-di-GMP-binding flagellar brake protein YcgR